eukprot:TRINITY_DN32699_c0_g1_i2.p2 TRINITY_DN32699_c0_g1~~TRINITY_DN32699_c0_g1_i2.p2  ORF type:complete len:135 (-),score=4.93 TRINITY_DN32699_c0_g1_i2:231-635(-)
MPPAPEDFLDIPLLDTWRAMEALVDSGLVRAIGVSNFSVQKLQQLLPLVRILPAVNQVEGHPYLQQLALKEFCDRNGANEKLCRFACRTLCRSVGTGGCAYLDSVDRQDRCRVAAHGRTNDYSLTFRNLATGSQ